MESIKSGLASLKDNIVNGKWLNRILSGLMALVTLPPLLIACVVGGLGEIASVYFSGGAILLLPTLLFIAPIIASVALVMLFDYGALKTITLGGVIAVMTTSIFMILFGIVGGFVSFLFGEWGALLAYAIIVLVILFSILGGALISWASFFKTGG